MFKSFVIGNLGGDAVTKQENGRTFTTFRVAHNERWRDLAGQEHDNVMWIDCIMNERPRVVDYLKAGTMVYVEGATRTRVYSSAKDRCMKAGVTIAVARVELLGGQSDAVPSRLVDSNGVMHDVHKFYWIDVPSAMLYNLRGSASFVSDAGGWISSVPNNLDGESAGFASVASSSQGVVAAGSFPPSQVTAASDSVPSSQDTAEHTSASSDRDTETAGSVPSTQGGAAPSSANDSNKGVQSSE